jgi:ATPase subunit of ABC transporter with duplicated ATPase domains
MKENCSHCIHADFLGGCCNENWQIDSEEIEEIKGQISEFMETHFDDEVAQICPFFKYQKHSNRLRD